MMLGLLVMAVGALIFIPAAHTRTYELFLLGLFIIGTGLSILQTASNPYITIVGPIESAAKRISIMGICNKIAGVMAPLILGAVVLTNADKLIADLNKMNASEKIIQLNELASRVIVPYALISVILFILAILIVFSPLPEIKIENEKSNKESIKEKKFIIEYPNL